MASTPTKKRSMFKRLFSKKSFDFDDKDEKVTSSQKRLTKQGSVDSPPPPAIASTSKQVPLIDFELANAPVGLKKRIPTAQPIQPAHTPDRTRKISTAKKKKCRKESTSVNINLEKPLDFPCTPELMLEYHKRKAFLSRNEEWLVMELNEYECLVENEEIIRMIAKHSKFFEVDPDELWEEFFQFVEEVSCYDDVINYDVWQEFRDKKYLC